MGTPAAQLALRTTHVPLLTTARFVAWRATKTFYTRPVLFLPSLIFPLLFLTAFGGALQRLAQLPGFEYAPGFTTYQWCFNMLQGAAISAAFVGFGALRDFDTGFMRRLFLTAQDRRGVAAGMAMTAAVRSVVGMAVITVVGLLVGVNLEGSVLEVGTAFLLLALTGQATALWSVGVAMRVRSVQGGPIIQMPIFVLFFMAPVFVPLDLLRGWLHDVASVNPISRVLIAERNLVAGSTEGVALAYALVGAMIMVGAVWAVTGVRRAERAG